VLQDREGLVFWTEERVALVMEEHAGRVAVVAEDGAVAHCPGPLDGFRGGRFRKVARGVMGQSGLGRLDDGTLVFPGGWRFSAPRGWPARSRVAEVPDPEVGDTGLRASQVRCLERRRGGATWVGDAGRVDVSEPYEIAVGRHPYLLKVGSRHVNLRRLRSLRSDTKGVHLGFDDGSELMTNDPAADELARGLGSSSPAHLDPFPEEHAWMYRLGLRDFPVALMEASADALRGWFGDDERSLIANVVWQAFRRRGLDYGRDHRGFWYRPLFPVLSRAGFMGEDAVRAFLYDPPQSPHYRLYLAVLSQMVGEARLITCHELGFEEPRAEMRGVGRERPAVLVLAEKSSLLDYTRSLARMFGTSWCVLGGEPSWLLSEFLARALLRRGVRRIRIVAYTDFDPQGWLIPDSLARQLDRYGLVVEDVCYLVRPSRFTEHELEYLGEPLSAGSETVRQMIRDWLKRSGGIHGRGIGIHADHLRPLERVIAAFVEETGLVALSRTPRRRV